MGRHAWRVAQEWHAAVSEEQATPSPPLAASAVTVFAGTASLHLSPSEQQCAQQEPRGGCEFRGESFRRWGCNVAQPCPPLPRCFLSPRCNSTPAFLFLPPRPAGARRAAPVVAAGQVRQDPCSCACRWRWRCRRWRVVQRRPLHGVAPLLPSTTHAPLPLPAMFCQAAHRGNTAKKCICRSSSSSTWTSCCSWMAAATACCSGMRRRWCCLLSLSTCCQLH